MFIDAEEDEDEKGWEVVYQSEVFSLALPVSGALKGINA